jgi:hypothetical protein
MPACLNVEPDLYAVSGARVRCLLYTEHAESSKKAV